MDISRCTFFDDVVVVNNLTFGELANIYDEYDGITRSISNVIVDAIGIAPTHRYFPINVYEVIERIMYCLSEFMPAEYKDVLNSFSWEPGICFDEVFEHMRAKNREMYNLFWDVITPDGWNGPDWPSDYRQMMIDCLAFHTPEEKLCEVRFGIVDPSM